MVKVMDGLNSMPWIALGRFANGWTVEGTSLPRRDKFKYSYDLWSNGLAFEAFGIGRTYKVSIRSPAYGNGMWLFNFDTRGRVVNASYTGSEWGDFTFPTPELPMKFRLLPYPHYRPEMHRLVGGTWLRAKWTDQFDHSGLPYRAEILDENNQFYQAAMHTLDEFVSVCRCDDVQPNTPDATELLDTYRTLPIRLSEEMKEEAARFHEILKIRGDIPVEAPELAFDHYHAIPVKVQDGCGGPCTFCSLYDRRIRIETIEEVHRQIDRMADYLGEELDHFCKVVLLEGDALTVPPPQLANALSYARDKFELGPAPFAHAFAKASTVARLSAEELRRLQAAGLHNVNIGLESGCQELLDRVKRGQDLGEVHDAVHKLSDLRINVSLNIICGLGGAKFQERHLTETVEFVKRLGPAVKVFYSRLAVSPDTHYARRQAQAFGGEIVAEEMARQAEAFERELRANEYLFVPM